VLGSGLIDDAQSLEVVLSRGCRIGRSGRLIAVWDGDWLVSVWGVGQGVSILRLRWCWGGVSRYES